MSKKKKKEPPTKVPMFPTNNDDAIPRVSMLEAHPDYARLVGCIVAEWTSIEYTMTWLITSSMERHGRIIQAMVYAVAAGGARLAMMEAGLRAIIPVRPGDTTLDELFAEADRLLKRRNHFAHIHYARNAKWDGVRTMKLKHLETDHPEASKELPLKELADLFQRMKNFNVAVGGLIQQVRLADLLEGPPPTKPDIGAMPDEVPERTHIREFQQPQAPPPPSEASPPTDIS
jgi:hypothetical protein